MSKRKSYSVSLMSLGHLKEHLHFGDFSQYWWETRQTENNSILYPIRLNMKTLVVLNETHFFITIIENHLHKPGYVCEANGLTSNVFDNSSAAINTHYWQLFSSQTKYLGPLIMGHDKPEINDQLLTDVVFHPFNCIYKKFTIFVYGIGRSSDDELCCVGPGFKSSFVCVIGIEKKSTLFVQEINHDNSIVKIYQDHKLVSTYIGSNPNDVWEKVGYLKNHKGTDLFGINQPQVQSLIQTICVPKCSSEEWNIVNKMESLWNYHLRKCTLASIPWNEFFIKWYNDKKTIIEITSALKKIYPPNYEFKEREIRAWKAMLSHAGCTNITPFANDISTVSHLYFKINYND
jgi:hypothetical protein